MTKARIIFSTLFILACYTTIGQFSVITDATLLRNFTRQQKFWAFGQSVQLNFYPADDKEAIYAWVGYYTVGKFKNNLRATAKDPASSPQQLPYEVLTHLRYRQISIGWKHYFIGSYRNEDYWNIYGSAGFGMLLGKAENFFDTPVDTSLYTISKPLEGHSPFKRLTFDLALGTEFPLGATVYAYTELRTWIPTSHYSSDFLYPNNYHIPSVATINLGLRVLIE